MPHLYVVIMAGGGGTRLWPQSKRLRPKQFLPLLPKGETLLGATVRRTLPVCPIERIFVVTAAEQVSQVRSCIQDLPVDNIIVEPTARNTAPCIGLSAVTVMRRDPDAILAVLPSDHHIQKEDLFAQTLTQASAVAAAGHVVTIGIRPERPETGYGYIHVGATDPELPAASIVESFVEKPDYERALYYVNSGSYLWNAGTFFFPARRIVDEINTLRPALGEILKDIAAHPERTPVRYPEAESISIDYAVMERLGRKGGAARPIRVVEASFGWNDVGSFAALYDLHKGDGSGNRVVQGAGPPPILVGSRDTLVWNSSGKLVAAAYVEDLVIAVTEDAVLVLPRAQSQEVRQVVERLKAQGTQGERYL